MLFGKITAKRKTNSFKPNSNMQIIKPTVSGVNVNAESAYNYSAFFACVKVISESIACLPWRVHIDDVKAPQSEHYLDKVLHKTPNPEMNAFIFKELINQHCTTWGNFYAEKEFNRNGEVVALWPLDPSKVDIDRDSSGNLVWEYSGNGASKVTLSKKEIFHVKGPSRDGIKGYSIIELARESISLGLATEAFGAAFFGNGAFPATVIMNTGAAKLTEEGEENLLKTFNSRNQGPKNARRTQYLSPGLDIKVIGIPPGDSQFLETRKFQLNEMCRFFRVPPHKIGDLERAIQSNIEAENITFLSDTLMPWVSRMESEANASLFKQSEAWRYYSKVNTKAYLRGDSKARAEWYKQLQGMGVYSIDDILALEDEELLGGEVGSLRLVPVNMTTPERIISGEIAGTNTNQNQQETLALFEREAKRLIKIELKQIAKVSDENKIASVYANLVGNAVDSFSIPCALSVGISSQDLKLHAILKETLTSFYTQSANEWLSALKAEKTDDLLNSWESSKHRKLIQTVIENTRGMKNV